MDTRIQKMASVIINYSTKVQPNDLVLFRGTSPLAQPLMQALTVEALKVGARPFNYMHMSEEDVLMMDNGSEAQIEDVNPMLKLMYETANVIVRIEAEENTRALAGFPPEKAKARTRARGGLINIQMTRQANGTLRRCTTAFPDARLCTGRRNVAQSV